MADFPNTSSSSSENDVSSMSASTPDKKGVFRAGLRSLVPTTKLNVTGETWIKHGDLVDLIVSCDGSGPWTYCWRVVPANYNVTGNESCR